jgi:hypothetical protein
LRSPSHQQHTPIPHGGEDQEATIVASAPTVQRYTLYHAAGSNDCTHLLGFDRSEKKHGNANRRRMPVRSTVRNGEGTTSKGE